MAGPPPAGSPGVQCGICLEEGILEVGELEGCDHRFCPPCILTWAKTDTRCPTCRARFATVARKRVALAPGALAPAHGPLPGEVLEVSRLEERTQVRGGACCWAGPGWCPVVAATGACCWGATPAKERKAVAARTSASPPSDAPHPPALQTWQPDPSLVAFLETVHCMLCGADDNDEQLLICDGGCYGPGSSWQDAGAGIQLDLGDAVRRLPSWSPNWTATSLALEPSFSSSRVHSPPRL
jgi:hypothetical protein